MTCRASAAAAAAAAAPAAPAAAPAAHHFWHEEAIKLEEPIIESKYTVKEKTPHTLLVLIHPMALEFRVVTYLLFSWTWLTPALELHPD